MTACNPLILDLLHTQNPNTCFQSSSFRPFTSLSALFPNPCIKTCPYRVYLRNPGIALCLTAVYPECAPGADDDFIEDAAKDTVEQLMTRNRDGVAGLMKMQRRSAISNGGMGSKGSCFPYLDKYRCGEVYLNSHEVLDAMGPHIMEERKERFRRVVENRSFSVCLVVEGLADFGNVSAAFRSADALGFQSVHVVSCDSSKRFRGGRHVSKGTEKWLDIELWNTTKECFKVLKSRGYRIATAHSGTDTVSVYDMDWSCPTAIVVGNEHRGISEDALKFSDLRCSIPMNGMVDSFNVSVAAGILMQHAVCDRTSRLGRHGDLTAEERQILLAEFSLRHSRSAVSIVHLYAKRKQGLLSSNL